MKKRMLKMTAAVASLILVLSMILMPMVAGALPNVTVPTPNGAAYSTSYENGVYTVDLDAAYLSDLLQNGQLTKENLKELMPEKVYNLIVDQDPAAVKSLLLDVVDRALELKNDPSETKAILVDVLKKVIKKVLDSDQGSALISGVQSQVGIASYEAAAPAIDFNSLLDQIPDDFVIDASNLDTLLNYANTMVNSGVIKVEDLENVVKDEELKEILGIPAEEEAPKIEDILAGKHNDQIIDAAENKGITAGDYKEQVIDKEELAKIDVSYESIIKNILATLKEDVITYISKIEAVRVNGAPVFSNAKFDLAAIEQAVIDSVPTIDQIAENLGADGEYAEIVSLTVKIIDTDYNAREYKLQVRFAGSKDDRAVLKSYAEAASKFVGYTFDKDGNHTIKLTLPEGFLPVCVSAIDEEKLPESLKAVLGDVATLDFSDKANTSVIVNAIVENFTINNYADLIDAVDVNNVDAALFETFKDRVGVTNAQFETALRYAVRTIDKAYNLADKYSKYGLDKVVDIMDSHKLSEVNYAGNGMFTVEGNVTFDVINVANRVLNWVDNRVSISIPDVPQYVIDTFENTTFRYSVTVAVEFDGLYEVEYVKDGVVVDTDYAFAGEEFKKGYADANLSTTVPEADTQAAELYTVTFERYLSVYGNETLEGSETFLYNELSDNSAIKPTEPAYNGYGAWTWDKDFATLPMADITVKGVAVADEYTINAGYTVNGKWNDLGTFTFTVEDYDDVVAEINALQLPAVKGYTAPAAWDEALPADFDAAVAAVDADGKLTVNATYVADEYKASVGYTVNGVWTELGDFTFTVENYDEVLASINALQLPAVDGYTTPAAWDAEVPANFDAAVAAIADGKLTVNATYKTITYTANVGYTTKDGWTDLKTVEFTVENYAELLATLKDLAKTLPTIKGYTTPTDFDAVPASFAEALAAMGEGTELKVNATYAWITKPVSAFGEEFTFDAETDIYALLHGLNFTKETEALNLGFRVEWYVIIADPSTGIAADTLPNGAVAVTPGFKLDPASDVTFGYVLVANDYTVEFKDGQTVLGTFTFSGADAYADGDPANAFDAELLKNKLLSLAPAADKKGYTYTWDVPELTTEVFADTAKAVAVDVAYTAVEYTIDLGYTTSGTFNTYKTLTFTVENYDAVAAAINALALPAVPGYTAPAAWANVPANFDEAYAALEGGVVTIDAAYSIVEYTAEIGYYVNGKWTKVETVKFDAVTFKNAISDKLNGIIKAFPAVNGYAKPTSWDGAPSDFLAAYYMAEGTSVRISAVYKVVDYTATFMCGKNVLATIKFNVENFSEAFKKLPVINRIGYETKWTGVPTAFKAENITLAATPIVYTAEFGYEVDGVWATYETVEFTVENFADVFSATKLPALPEVEGYKAIKWNVPHTFAEAYEQLKDGKITVAATLAEIVPETDKPEGPTYPDYIPGKPHETEPIIPGGTTDDDKGGFPWWIIIVILLVILIILILIFVLRKKDDEEPVEEPEEEVATEFEDETETTVEPIIVATEIEVVKSVDADTVDEMMTDDTAQHLIETAAEAGGVGKMAIINVGTISENYEDGDTVTLESLKEKGLVGASAGRIKVLAAGTLDKHLTVKADAFSVQAVKMIALTGGHAMKLGGAAGVDADVDADVEVEAAPEAEDAPETDAE